MNISKINTHLKFLIPAVLTALLVLDGLMGYVAPDPYEGLDLGSQTAYAAEPPELEIEQADAEKVVSKGPADKLAPVKEDGEYKDGTYTGVGRGFGGLIKVKVTIKNGKMVSIKIVSAPGETGSFLAKASAVTGRIIKAQSTNVDAVSGATYSSNGIIKAVRNALAKAVKKKDPEKKPDDDDDDKDTEEKEDPEKPEVITEGKWKDGTYTGEGEGFSGKLHVKVTIKNGKITSLKLIDSMDDDQFMGKARPSIFDAVIKAQSTDVDAVTGATYSSYGLIQAINDALRKAAADADPDESDDDIASNDDEDNTDPGDDDPGTDDPGSTGGTSGSGKYKDGTYSDTVACTRAGWFDYDINISLTVSGGKITSLNITKGDDYTEEEYQEDNDDYLDYAVNGGGKVTGMKARIIEAQNADVDTVTGATYSSKAIRSGVAGILSGIVTDDEAGEEPEEEADVTPEADVTEDDATPEQEDITEDIEEPVEDEQITEDDDPVDSPTDIVSEDDDEPDEDPESGDTSADSGTSAGDNDDENVETEDDTEKSADQSSEDKKQADNSNDDQAIPEKDDEGE